MKELVGYCSICGNEIFCLEGFLNGVTNNGVLCCFSCSKEIKEKDDK